MSISEQVGFLDDAIKGHVKVQLMEQGKVVREVQGDNFIGKSLYNWLLAVFQQVMQDFSGNPINSSSGRFCGRNAFERFTLTDNAAPVSNSALVIPGSEVGYVLRQPYSGSDNKRGTVNVFESGIGVSGNVFRMVMDFPTNAGNGTFQTLGFRGNSSYFLPSSDLGIRIFPSSWNSGGFPGAFDGTNIYWVMENGSLSILDVNTRIQTFSPIIPELIGNSWSSASYTTGAWYGGYLYLYKRDNRQLYKINTSDFSLLNMGIVHSGVYSSTAYPETYGIAVDGTRLYIRNRYRLSSSTSYFSVGSVMLSNVTTGGMYRSHNDTDNYPYDQVMGVWGQDGVAYAIKSDGAVVNLTEWITNNTFIEISSYGFLSVGLVAISDIGGDRFSLVRSGAPYLGMTTSAGSTDSSLMNTTEALLFYKNAHLISLSNLGTCVVLPTPVTKTSEQTMKITYELTFNFK